MVDGKKVPEQKVQKNYVLIIYIIKVLYEWSKYTLFTWNYVIFYINYNYDIEITLKYNYSIKLLKIKVNYTTVLLSRCQLVL